MAKPVVITDDAVVNLYGFRVLTAGGDLTQYRRNPVLLYDHTRHKEWQNDKEIILPIGKMVDLKVEGTRIVATPEFDLEDDFAADVARKWDKDMLNMASIGFEPIELSEDPAYMLPGQKYPTVTKWKLQEVSITDIGANSECCKLLHAGKVLQLNSETNPNDIKDFFSHILNQNEVPMKKVIAQLNATGLAGNLPETATEELVAAGIQAMHGALSAKDQEIITLKKKNDELVAAAKSASETALKDKATALVENALSAKKIIAEQKAPYITLASASEDGYAQVKTLLENAKPHASVISQLKAGEVEGDQNTPTALKAEFIKRTNAKDGEPTMEDLKAENPERFNLVLNAGLGKTSKA